MNIHIVGNIFFSAADHMQFAVFAHLKPTVPVVMKGFGNGLQHHHFGIKFGSPGQVGHVNGGMIKMGFVLCMTLSEQG